MQLLVADAVPLCLSPQVCREFMVVLTRQPVSGRSFTVDEALNALEHWRSGCALLEETDAAFLEWLRLVRKHQVQGKQAHDCNIVAVMLAHGVRRLATVDRRGADPDLSGDLSDSEEPLQAAVQLVEVRWQQNVCEACAFAGIVGLRRRSHPEWLSRLGDRW